MSEGHLVVRQEDLTEVCVGKNINFVTIISDKDLETRESNRIYVGLSR